MSWLVFVRLAADTSSGYGYVKANPHGMVLPTTLAHIGLKNPERNIMKKVAEKACAPAEGIHHEAGIITLTPERVLNAMLMADSYGKSRMPCIASCKPQNVALEENA